MSNYSSVKSYQNMDVDEDDDDYSDDCFDGNDVKEGVFKLQELTHSGHITKDEEIRRKQLIFQFIDYQKKSYNNSSEESNSIYGSNIDTEKNCWCASFNRLLSNCLKCFSWKRCVNKHVQNGS